MREGILALYDTTEIQKYVYSSNKLKDNIGASELVDKCFKEFLVETIKEVCLGKAKIKWSEDKSWRFQNDSQLKAEIVYIGGGNALVAIDNENTWKDINYKFGQKLLVEARGLNFVTVCTKITNSFKNDLDKLFTSINEKKYNYRKINGVKGLSITKECAITKNTATSVKDEQAISYEVLRKRENSKIDEKNNILDDIAGSKGESYIAVVHIDGNNMGKKVEKIISLEQEYYKAIEKLRDFSFAIEKAYKKAYEKMVKDFEDIIFKSDSTNEVIKEYKKLFTKKGENIIPFRKILIKGDDVTYISYGKIAISSLEKYFEYLKVELGKNKLTEELNACGGIALVKPHFPFSDAYEIAEQCCANAKNIAKTNDHKKVGYYFDFHIVRGSMMGTLEEVRENQYSTNNGEEGTLLARPFSIEKSRKAIIFRDIKDLVMQLKNSKIPRNKVKELRDAFIYGEEEVKIAISKMQSRGFNVMYKGKDVLELDNGVKIRKDAPLFDAIEFMELYDDLFIEKGE